MTAPDIDGRIRWTLDLYTRDEDENGDPHPADYIVAADGAGNFQIVPALSIPGVGIPGIYLPETYGAVGDDTTDDSTAIQDACDAAGAAGGGVVLIGPHSYKITTDIEITDPHVHIWGVGNEYGPSIIRQATAHGTALNFSSTWPDAARTYQSSVRNLMIKGPTGGSATSGIGIWTQSNINLDNVGIHGFYDGLYWDNQTYYSRARGCFFTGQSHASIVMDETNNCTVDTCRITGDPLGVASLNPIKIGVWITSTGSFGIGNRVVNSSIEYFSEDGLLVDGGYAQEFVGNYFETGASSSGHAHITIGENRVAYSTRISSSYFQGDSTSGFDAIKLDRATGVVISDSMFGLNHAINIASTANTHNVLLWNNRNSPAGTFTLPTDSYTLDPAAPPMSSGTTAGGDLGGTYPNPDVVAIQGVAVTDAGTTGTVLTKTSGSAATWQSPAVGASGVGPILIEDTPAGSPLIFADLLQNDAGDDLLYSDAT